MAAQDYVESTVIDWLLQLVVVKRYDLIDTGICNYLDLDTKTLHLTWLLYHYTCGIKAQLPHRNLLLNYLVDDYDDDHDRDKHNMQSMLHKLKRVCPL